MLASISLLMDDRIYLHRLVERPGTLDGVVRLGEKDRARVQRFFFQTVVANG